MQVQEVVPSDQWLGLSVGSFFLATGCLQAPVRHIVCCHRFNPVHGIELNCDVEVGATTKVQAAEDDVQQLE